LCHVIGYQSGVQSLIKINAASQLHDFFNLFQPETACKNVVIEQYCTFASLQYRFNIAVRTYPAFLVGNDAPRTPADTSPRQKAVCFAILRIRRIIGNFAVSEQFVKKIIAGAAPYHFGHLYTGHYIGRKGKNPGTVHAVVPVPKVYPCHRIAVPFVIRGYFHQREVGKMMSVHVNQSDFHIT
jgi:hypothetical protein